jgi:riboflavin kinase/FMN adenylyltransferase
MKVTPLSDAVPKARRVAVGTFDGVHAGHRAVIGDADTVLTFDPHPLEIIAPDRAPGLLTSTGRKAELVSELGVEEMVVIPFDRSFSTQTGQEFIDAVLVDRLGATEVRVGENFRFGKGAVGDAALLASQPSFQATVVELLERDGRVVSSSWIRELVSGGQIDAANGLMESSFEISGRVAQGEKRGTGLGYPTANLEPDPRRCLPAYGVYSALAILEDGSEVPSAVSIGTRPTFDSELGELIEAHLIDFDGDLYGAELKLHFRDRLRPELEFDDAQALIEQMEKDVADAKSVLAGG